MSQQFERSLQTEIMWRTKRLPIIAAPIPNGIWLPAHSEEEKHLIARLVARMKSDGMLVPGLPDLAVLWKGGGAFVELKRPASKDLFGLRSPAGRLSDAQKEVRDRCLLTGINYGVASHWAEFEALLLEWGALR